ncbi:hypothetical protein T484DRAFT_1747607 [Baffinella frigidus]|nr:hypothetical protein T484DRAFT_1747607 [Cryptophyta sp. CCMP2293]
MSSYADDYRTTDTVKIRLPKGHYWVGDLEGYALSDDETDDLSEKFRRVKGSDVDGSGIGVGGKFVLGSGRVVVAFICDGKINEDTNDFPYDTPDGYLFGITKLKGLEMAQEYRKYAGRIVHYHKPFDCYTSTIVHRRRDERHLHIYFGKNAYAYAEGGRWEEGDSDDSACTDESGY